MVEMNSSGDELLKTSSKETNCLETKSWGTHIHTYTYCRANELKYISHTCNYFIQKCIII